MIQDSRKLLRALDNLTNETIHAEQYFTDELHLFFQYLCRKLLKELDLKNPLDSLFHLEPNNIIEKYWKEYDKIFSYYVDVGATIGNIHYDILLNASKAHAKEFASTKSRETVQSLLDYKFNSEDTDTLFKPDPKVSSRLKRYKFEASEKTKARVTEDINNILGEAYREGWGPRHVGEKIQERFNQLSGYEARRIAQTELNTTRNMVQYNRLKDDEMPYKIWHSAHDARTRKSHLDVDEEIVPIDEKFSNGLMYPGDKSGPIREWVNCRCSHAAFIMPLGYEAPSFFPFRESDLVKVGSSVSSSYIPELRERLGLVEGIVQGAVTERERQRVAEEPIESSISSEVSHPYSDAVEEQMDNFEKKARTQKVEYLQFYTDDGLVSPLAKGNWGEVRTTGAQQKWLEEQTKKGKRIHATHNHPTEYKLGEGNPTLLSDGDHRDFMGKNYDGINLVSLSAEGPDNRYTIYKLDNFDDHYKTDEQRRAIDWVDGYNIRYVKKYYENSPELKMLREIKADLKAQGIDWRTKMRESPEWWESIQQSVKEKVRKMREEDHARLIKKSNEILNPVGLAIESSPRK